MTHSMEEMIRLFTQALSRIDAVTAVGTSTLTLPVKKGDGDIDVFIYCSSPLGEAGKNAAYMEIPFSLAPRHRFDSRIWGNADYAEIGGVETWLMYFTEGDVLRDMEEVRSGRSIGNDNGYYPVGRLAMFTRMRILYERAGFITGIQEKLRIYPMEMKRAIIEQCRNELRNEEDLLRAETRGDVLFYHVSIDRAIDSLLQLLFASNETYFPSRKRNRAYIDAFDSKPVDFYTRLMNVIELGARGETIGESLSVFRALKEETIKLISA
jgi:hypothetical protein